MENAVFLVNYAGKDGFGSACIALIKGRIYGTDVGGCAYSGSYDCQVNHLVGEIILEVPPGTQMVTGQPVSSQPYTIRFNISIPANISEQQVVSVQFQLPHGPVNANIRKMQNITI